MHNSENIFIFLRSGIECCTNRDVLQSRTALSTGLAIDKMTPKLERPQSVKQVLDDLHPAMMVKFDAMMHGCQRQAFIKNISKLK